jgi:hypothetical protein
MTVTTRIYYSTDSSAPVLSGTTGSLITLLDAVLVNGYGSRQAAGWTKPYSDAGAYKAVFRQGGGNQKYLRIRDDGVLPNVRHADCRFFKTMSDVDTGTGQFPSTSLTNHNISKSYTADSTARPWIIIATDRSFYIWVQLNTANTDILFFLGDITNIYERCKLTIACCSIYNNTTPVGTNSFLTELSNGFTPDQTFGYSYDEFYKTSIYINKFGNYNYSKGATCFGGAGQTYPNPGDSKLHMGRIGVQTANDGLAGYLPGLWNPYHLKPLAHGDTFSAIDKQFIVLNCEAGAGQCFIELSNTWY